MSKPRSHHRCRYCNATKRIVGGKCEDREACFQRTLRAAEKNFGTSTIDPKRQAELYEAQKGAR